METKNIKSILRSMDVMLTNDSDGQSAKQLKGTTDILVVILATQPPQLIMSDALMRHLYIYVFILLCGGVAILGMVSNVVNMVIFVKLGLKDSMAVCLFSLSFTDFLLSTLTTLDRAFPIWNFFYHGEGIDPRAVFYVSLAWITDSLFLCSGMIITLMSLERCVCVIWPFKVRRVFTRSRSVVAVVVILVLTTASYIPLYLSQGLGWVDDRIQTTENETRVVSRLAVFFSDDRKDIQSYVSIASAALFQFPSMLVTLGSVLAMVYGLKASSRLRQTMTSTTSSTNKDDPDGEKSESRLTSKTRTLVKMVLFLAVIFMLASVPRFVAVSIKLFYPEISEDGRQRNLNDFQWQFGRLLATFNASVNIFVYFRINSSYRGQFHQLISIARKMSKG